LITTGRLPKKLAEQKGGHAIPPDGRLDGGEVPLSHEFLGLMFGTVQALASRIFHELH
jgi:hypothetical protein